MPGFVNVVGIAGDGIDLAAHGLEFVVEVCQVLQSIVILHS